MDVKEDSILVAQQGEQDAATATIMATVDQQGKYLSHGVTILSLLCIELLTSLETRIALAQGDDHRQGRHFSQYLSSVVFFISV